MRDNKKNLQISIIFLIIFVLCVLVYFFFRGRIALP